MNSTSKIIALDLQNATLENLENWFCTNDYITAETTKEFIRFRVKDEENQFQRIFVINDTFFGIVSKDNLTEFLIKKLDHIGLNNQETNEFIQYWLPILERNKYIFIHFLVNEECNKIATLNVNPKPETSIRIYMEFYGLENRTIIKEQQLPKTERKGFTLVEWGGADFTGEMSEEDFFKINDLPILNGITLICKRRDINDIKPLYVIDNKISSKRIFDRLNPSEIKKIETFSGKDGVALYGSDGVGGVFIITTKNPKK